jgi:hypothetical protein
MRTEINRTLMAIAALVFLLSPIEAAQAQDPVDRALQACKPEIENFCDQVTPGNGRLLACFVAHEDKVSGTCSWALYEAMAELEAFTNAIAYVASSCRDDMVEHCGQVQMGEGRVGLCLIEHEEQVSPACRQAMKDVEMAPVEN